MKILNQMVHATSDDIYMRRYRELTNMRCPGVQAYFDQNWHPLKEQWVAHYTNASPNFENNTNNRLENLNQKIKTVVTKYSSLAVFFNDLIILLSSFNTERDHIAALNVMRHPLITNNTVYDEQNAKYLTQYAFSKYKEQSNKSGDIEFSRITEVDADCFERNVRITVTHQNCSCTFFSSMQLPCAHIIAFLLLNRENEVFNPDLCSDRWKRATAQYMCEFNYVMPDVPTSSQLELVSVSSQNQQPRRLNEAQKYKAAEKETKQICNLLSEKTQPTFERLMKSLTEFRKCIELNITPGKLYFILLKIRDTIKNNLL